MDTKYAVTSQGKNTDKGKTEKASTDLNKNTRLKERRKKSKESDDQAVVIFQKEAALRRGKGQPAAVEVQIALTGQHSNRTPQGHYIINILSTARGTVRKTSIPV